jgi:hypothetical protein
MSYVGQSRIVSNPEEHKGLGVKITEKNNKNTEARRCISFIMIYTSKILKEEEEEKPRSYYD